MNKKIKVPWKKNFIKRMFCKHDFQYYKEEIKGKTVLLASGERRHYVCSKCGKYNGSVFLEYEGLGFK